MKILLDHNLDRRLKRYFQDHEVLTTQENGWADVLNGELLRLAESNGFEIMITADSNIKAQQNMNGRSISIIVLRAGNNRLTTHSTMIASVDAAIASIQKGEITEVFHKDFL
ncbi:MAG: DUF5615 family PIN-like protein [Pyrinomonadaceae bacterium]